MNEGRPVPVVRDEHGAILGADYRQTELAPEGVRVPGRVPARVVFPGDRVTIAGIEAVVRRVHKGDVVRLITRTDKGGQIVFERRPDEIVHVSGVGAFER